MADGSFNGSRRWATTLVLLVSRSCLERIGTAIHQGVYRIIYAIEDRELVVVVVTVGHRREVYREGR